MKLQALFAITFLLIFGSCSHGPENFNKMAEQDALNDRDFIPDLNIKKGETVCVIGAGGGYYSVKLANTTGITGMLYAVDIDAESIEYIKKYAAKKNVKNIKTILATFTDSKLEKNSCDLVFLRNTYHDISDRVIYFRNLKLVIKKGGRLAIIDYDPVKLNFIRKRMGHSIEKDVIISELKEAGYLVRKKFDYLKKQSFILFEAK